MIWKRRDRRTNTHFLSWFLRPLLEHSRVRTVIGTNLIASLVIVHSLPPIGGPIQTDAVEVALLAPEDIQVITEKTFRIPLKDFRGYSQGFRQFHAGVDMKSPRGTPIYAATNGVVSEIETRHTGYGNKVVVQHDNGFYTLYAHLDKINVKEADSVTRETVLGTVGLTGRTTGPHLHFEIRTKSGVINPKQVLPEVEEKKTVS